MRRLAVLAVLVGCLMLAPAAFAVAPSNVDLPTVSGTLTEGSQLAVTQGVWSNTSTAPSLFSYEWDRCNGGSCIAIPWAVESGYIPIRADVGYTLKVRVTATDASSNATTVTTTPYGPVATNSATAYYVDGASTGGTCSDSATTTQAQATTTPWCSLTHAVSALAATSTPADIIVRACSTCAAGAAGYKGTQIDGQIDLTNDLPTATVTIEPYGNGASQADSVLVSGFWMSNTSNYSIDGLNLGDPALSSGQSGAGCPYITQADNLAGNLPSADYCQPAPNIQMQGGTSNITLADDNATIILNTALNVGPFCGSPHCPLDTVKLYGDRFHNPGWDCTMYEGMTTSATITAGTPITSIPINPTTPSVLPAGSSTTIPSGSRVTLINGPLSNPTNIDQTAKNSGSTPPSSTSINTGGSFTPTNTYASGSTVVASFCAGSSQDLLLHGDTGRGGTNAVIQNWTIAHTEYDHTNWAAVALGATNTVFDYDTFDYIESPTNVISHADGLVDAGLDNFTYTHNLMYNVGLAVLSLCNGSGGTVSCGSNFTIANNVSTGCAQPCMKFNNAVGGTNYLINNTLWDGGNFAAGGDINLSWTDSCCNGTAGQPAAGQWYVENNITDGMASKGSGTTGGVCANMILSEDHNQIADQTSSTSCSGQGTGDIYGNVNLSLATLDAAVGFATPIGSNCGGNSFNDTQATDNGGSVAGAGCNAAGVTTSSWGGGNFNAALLAGSPALGAGITGANIPTTDFLGNVRTGPYDMGAFDFDVDGQGAAPSPNGPPIPLPPYLLVGGNSSSSSATALDIAELGLIGGAVLGGGAAFLIRRRKKG